MYLCMFQPISEDDVDRISTLLRVLVDRLPLMSEVFEQRCRQALSAMLGAKAEEDKLMQKVSRSVANYVCIQKELTRQVLFYFHVPLSLLISLTGVQEKESRAVQIHIDDPIRFIQLTTKSDLDQGEVLLYFICVHSQCDIVYVYNIFMWVVVLFGSFV